MKNNFLKLTLGCLLIGLTACSDFLEEMPRALQSEDAAFVDETSARLVVNGMYDPIAWGESNTLTGGGHSYEFVFGDICTDDSEKGSNDADQIDIQRLKDFDTNGGNGNIVAMWNAHWVAIARANAVLKNLETSPLSDNIKASYEAEAKFIRAYSYMLLVRYYGGVPLFEEPVSTETINERAFTRASIAEIYQLVDADLEFAMNNLDPKGVNPVGVATSGAAVAYLARSYMYQIGTDNTNGRTWQQVFDLTQRFIDGDFGGYALAANYATIFEAEGENNIESIFEIQAVDNGLDAGTEGTGVIWTVFQNPNFLGGWGFNTPTVNLAQSFEDNDPRRPATTIGIGEYAYGVEIIPNERNATGYYHRKVIIEPGTWNTEKGSSQNIRKFRYADILLMNGEAAYHLGNTSITVERIQTIRQRASNSTFPKGYDPSDPAGYQLTGFARLDNTIIPTSGTALLDFLLLERRREFGLEQLRFIDLVRTGRYGDYMAARGKADALTSHTIAGENPIPVFPIPNVDLEDWGISQNPGY